MSDQFVGRRVKIQTVHHVIEGTVSSIENGLLHLTNVSSKDTGETLDKIIISGDEIQNVEVFPENAAPKSTGRKAKKQHPRQEVSDDNVHQEFDFAANLSKFDKQKVFEEISNLDSKPESERLVSHNKRSSPKIPHNENVLSPEVVHQAVHLTGPNGVLVPCASALQLTKIEQTMLRAGFHTAGIDERAATGIVDVVTHAVGRQGFGQKLPLIIVLVGCHRTGAVALAAARRLVNVGCPVIAVSPSAPDGPLEAQARPFTASGGVIVTSQKGLFEEMGKHAPLEMIIDALEGYEAPLVDQLDADELKAAQWLIHWANGEGAAKLSINAASGLSTGEAVRSTWLVSCGFPLISSSGSSPQHFVADIGIPKQVLTKMKLKRFTVLNYELASVLGPLSSR